MAYLEKYLYLKKSKLPGAGMGLFTSIDIAKGTRIVEYKGRLQPWKEVKDEDGHNGYIFKLHARLAINALPYKKALGRFANDAKGLVRVEGLRNNAEYETEGKKCFIDAIRHIKKNEEILVEYGGNFWSLVKKIQREKKRKKEAASPKVS